MSVQATAASGTNGGWRFLTAPVARPRTPVVLAGALAIGIAFDVAFRAGIAGVAGTFCVILACAVLIVSGRIRRGQPLALLGAAAAFSIWLPIRASLWLLPFDVLAICALVALACSLRSGGNLWDLSIPRVVLRAAQAVTQFFLAPRFLVGWARTSTSRLGGILRGIAIAVPVLLVLGALLSSADAVFASFVSLDIDMSAGLEHVVLIGAGTLAAGWLLRLASLDQVDEPVLRGPRLGATEWTLVLGSLNLLLAAFAAAQLVALSEGGRRVIRSAGLTYADYARSGFFQLLAAAIVVTATLLVLRASAQTAERDQIRRFRILAVGVIAFTMLIVVTAFQRLVLYERVFGLTMLRIYVQTAIVGVAIFLIMLALTVLGVGARRAWLWPAAGVAALGMLFALNVMNPEAFVASYNIEHTERIGRFDPSYLGELGDDAVPALVRGNMESHICVEPPEPDHGWASFNLGRQRAMDIRAESCR